MRFGIATISERILIRAFRKLRRYALRFASLNDDLIDLVGAS